MIFRGTIIITTQTFTDVHGGLCSLMSAEIFLISCFFFSQRFHHLRGKGSMKTGHSKTNSEPRYNIEWQSANVLTNCTENFKTLHPGSTYVERQVSPQNQSGGSQQFIQKSQVGLESQLSLCLGSPELQPRWQC